MNLGGDQGNALFIDALDGTLMPVDPSKYAATNRDVIMMKGQV